MSEPCIFNTVGLQSLSSRTVYFKKRPCESSSVIFQPVKLRGEETTHDSLYCLVSHILLLHLTARVCPPSTQQARGYFLAIYRRVYCDDSTQLHQHVVDNLFRMITCNSAMKGWFVTHDIWLIATVQRRWARAPAETAGPTSCLRHPEDQLKASGLLVFGSLRDQFIFMFARPRCFILF